MHDVTDGQLHATLSHPGALSGFDLWQAPLGLQLVLAVAALLQLFSILWVAVALFDRQVRWRLLWSLASLFGVAKIALDWTTHAWDVLPISVEVPVLMITHLVAPGGAPTGNWIVSLGLPLPAFGYWLVRTAAREPKVTADVKPSAGR